MGFSAKGEAVVDGQGCSVNFNEISLQDDSPAESKSMVDECIRTVKQFLVGDNLDRVTMGYGVFSLQVTGDANPGNASREDFQPTSITITISKANGPGT